MKNRKVLSIIIKVLAVFFLIQYFPMLFFKFRIIFSDLLYISSLSSSVIFIVVFIKSNIIAEYIINGVKDSFKKDIDLENQYLMKRVLFSTFSFCVLLFFVFFIHTIIRIVQDQYMKLAEPDLSQLYKFIIYSFSRNFLSGLFIMIILPVVGYFVGSAGLSFILKRRVPVFTAILSVIIFWLIRQWFWSGATDPDPYGAAIVFFILSPFIGGFSGAVAFVPLFFIENYLKKTERR
ncbi:hypothetical protein KAU33_14195 [Candidatus Dependentiae bacterium]|nr:hypothetical protein [Candidatus Dependentiae bacterium]